MKDQDIRRISEGMKLGEELEVEGGNRAKRAFVGEGAVVLHRLRELNGRKMWQRWVPEHLREKCMKIFHEGLGHPGGQRSLETARLHYYWDGMRLDMLEHCEACVACKLRKAYNHRPKVPVQR